MILLWGVEEDPPLTAVLERVAARGLPLMFVDQSRLSEFSVELDLRCGWDGTLAHRGTCCRLSAIKSAYIRPHQIAAADPHRQAVEGALADYCDHGPWSVLNRPSAMASNGSKPYQLRLIEDCGFQTPDTLITNNLDALRAFHATCERVIYKSISSARSVVGVLDIGDGQRLADLVSFPTMFQQQVQGDDFRVHVVGDALFACRITSGGSDYRYANDTQVVGVELPTDVAANCMRAARKLGLPLAGIDLRRTSEGAWYVFEVNPSPGFTYYEARTGQPIADAIADLLASAPGWSAPRAA